MKVKEEDEDIWDHQQSKHASKLDEAESTLWLAVVFVLDKQRKYEAYHKVDRGPSTSSTQWRIFFINNIKPSWMEGYWGLKDTSTKLFLVIPIS